MTKKCLKCGHERTPADTAPDYECPQCGAIYAKVEAAHAKPPKSDQAKINAIKAKTAREKMQLDSHEPNRLHKTREHTQHPETSDTNKKYTFISTVLISLIIGYFAGREHVKYEVRQAVTEAASKITQNFSRAFSPNESSSQDKQMPEEAANKNGRLVGIALVDKGYRDFDVDIGNKAVTFTLEFTNNLDKDIRAFNGILSFNDILDNNIKSLNLKFTDPIPAHQTISWEGEMNYNQFKDSDRRLRSKDISDIKVSLSIVKLLYADGTTEEF